jgi:exonuclease SbcD
MTRILHTSDWHLGATLDGLSRDEEHALFLAWLATTLEERDVDVLVVSGDVFDQTQPSAEAQRMYYELLRRVADLRVRKVVVVGGNHDSASRLDAPEAVLASLDVHVVGGVLADRDSWDRCLCPIRNEDGVVECVIVAVPFVHEFRLGVRAAFRDDAETRSALTEAFRSFYTELADRAEALAEGAPIIATGHLAAEGSDRADAPSDIHMIGTVGALRSAIFDPRYRYVALGHIHRAGRVVGSRAWYCGTPVALNAREAQSKRCVLLFDTDAPGDDPIPECLDVPVFRSLVEVQGRLEEVCRSIKTLSWDAPLAPFVIPQVEVDHYTAGLEAQVVSAAASNVCHGIRVVQPRQVVRREEEAAPESGPTPIALRELLPEDVFRQLCARRGMPLDADLMGAFRSLLSMDEEVAV